MVSAATSSSALGEHSPGEVVDGLLTEDSCFWSAPDESHWWMVDLGGDMLITKIRVTNTVRFLQLLTLTHCTSPCSLSSLPSPPPPPSPIPLSPQFEWILAKAWGTAFIDPFTITLTDSYGNQVHTLHTQRHTRHHILLLRDRTTCCPDHTTQHNTPIK